MARFTLRSAAYLIFTKENKVLLARRQNTKYFDGYYNLPCGHLDGGETAKEAAAREAMEEVGLVVKPEDLEFAHLMHRRRTAFDGQLEYLDIYFKVNKWSGKPKITEPEKCDDVAWFPLDKLPENIIPCHKKGIEAYLNSAHYSEEWE